MAETRTPARAEETGDRWRWRGYYCLAAAVPFVLFGYETLFWCLVVVSLACARAAAGEYGWRNGWVERERVSETTDPHPWQEWNAYGNSCHYPGCRLDYNEHVPAGERS